jgi:EamA domain-containing membrane protein RarD
MEEWCDTYIYIHMGGTPALKFKYRVFFFEDFDTVQYSTYVCVWYNIILIL